MMMHTVAVQRILQTMISLLLLWSTSAQAAVEVAERIRSSFEQVTYAPGTGGENTRLTVSIGATELLPDESPDQFLFRADQAMYHAKSNRP